MNYLFEKSDALNTPIECFFYNASQMFFPVRPHWHYFMEIIFVTSGEAEVHVGNSVYTAREGD
ncbi:MAG: cupin domain-containing protein, partial [Oscillospiraceae bacterium]